MRSASPGSRRNAKASTNGVRSSAAAVTPDSTLCAEACHETLSHRASMPWQSSRKTPSRAMPTPTTASPTQPSRGSHPAPERAPQADREPDHEQTRQVRRHLVVEPGARRRERAEIADVVVRGAERVGLREVTEENTDDEADRSGEPAQGGDPVRHRRSVSDRRLAHEPLCTKSVRIAGAAHRSTTLGPGRCAVSSHSPPSRRSPPCCSRRPSQPRRASSGRASRTSRASSSPRTGRSRSTSCEGRDRVG